MKTIHWLVILVVVAGAAYYLVGWGGGVRVKLAEQNASGEQGKLVLREVNGTVEATLTVSGQPEGVSQPAHIHNGTCAEIGAVVYPLAFPKDGAASVTVLQTTLAEMEAKGALAVNVHKSTTEPQKYVACGELDL